MVVVVVVVVVPNKSAAKAAFVAVVEPVTYGQKDWVQERQTAQIQEGAAVVARIQGDIVAVVAAAVVDHIQVTLAADHNPVDIAGHMQAHPQKPDPTDSEQ